MNSSNKKIAKNTLYMYFRLLCTLFIGLYSSRIVLQVLGVSDYGLFCVVGGILAMFTFIRGSLGAASTRFFNTEMGKEDGDVCKSFNVNLLLHIILAFFILILCETLGLWYVINRLNIDPDKLNDTLFVFHVSVVTTCVGLINSPYACLFTAHERFKFLAQFDIFNTILRFVFILLLQFYQGEYTLRLYALIMCVTTADTFVVYHWIANRDWPYIIKHKLVRGWNNYKEVLTFCNWNLLATMAMMARSSGADLVINSFFGTSINGAFAIGKSVNNYVMQFSCNIDSASGPQIIQSYASGDSARYTYLANKMGRFCLLVFLVVFFPLYVELEYVLELWLKDVPEGALEFTQWNLILGGVSLTGAGITQVISASGKIKWFKINLSTFFLLCIPLAYILYELDYPAYSILILFVIADIIQRCVQLWQMKYILHYDIIAYVKDAYLRPLFIVVIMTIGMNIYWSINPEAQICKLFGILAFFIMVSALVLFVGMTAKERMTIYNGIRNKILIS